MAAARRSRLNPSTLARFEAIATGRELSRFVLGIGPADAPSRVRAARDISGLESVLDIGCGPGVFMDTLVNAAAAVQTYVGVDGSAGFVTQAQAVAASSPIPVASVQLHDLDEVLPFETLFEAVVIRHVLEHLERPEFALGEAARVCGDVLVLVFSQFPNSGPRSVLTDADMKLPRWSHPAVLMEAVLTRAGFTIQVQDQYSPDTIVEGVLADALSPREAYWVAERNPLVPPVGG